VKDKGKQLAGGENVPPESPYSNMDNLLVPWSPQGRCEKGGQPHKEMHEDVIKCKGKCSKTNAKLAHGQTTTWASTRMA
jgi:hypothetical protein